MPLEGNSGLILTAARSDWWIETRTADPFSWTMRNGISDIWVRIPVALVFGLEKFLGLWTEGIVSEIHIISVTA